MKKQSLQLNILLTPENRKLLDEINTLTGVKDQPIMQAMLSALANLWRETGEISLPLRFEPRRETLLPSTPEQVAMFKLWQKTLNEVCDHMTPFGRGTFGEIKKQPDAPPRVKILNKRKPSTGIQ